MVETFNINLTRKVLPMKKYIVNMLSFLRFFLFICQIFFFLKYLNPDLGVFSTDLEALIENWKSRPISQINLKNCPPLKKCKPLQIYRQTLYLEYIYPNYLLLLNYTVNLNETCPVNTKQCGLLDKTRIFCVAKTMPCPINLIIASPSRSKPPYPYTFTTLELINFGGGPSVFIHYTNESIDSLIPVSFDTFFTVPTIQSVQKGVYINRYFNELDISLLQHERLFFSWYAPAQSKNDIMPKKVEYPNDYLECIEKALRYSFIFFIGSEFIHTMSKSKYTSSDPRYFFTFPSLICHIIMLIFIFIIYIDFYPLYKSYKYLSERTDFFGLSFKEDKSFYQHFLLVQLYLFISTIVIIFVELIILDVMKYMKSYKGPKDVHAPIPIPIPGPVPVPGHVPVPEAVPEPAENAEDELLI